MFGKFISYLLPLIPKKIVYKIAKTYVAGESFESAIKKSKEINKDGFLVALDILGEDLENIEEIKVVVLNYKKLIDKINLENIEGYISLKLTHLGLRKSYEICEENFFSILKKAKTKGIFVRIDMEDSSVTEDTIKIYLEGKKIYENIGIAIQAYMKRSEKDIDFLKDLNANIRLCKGIYKESSEIVFKGKKKVRENFIELAKNFLNGNGYLAIATHDIYLIDELVKYIEKNKISKNNLEFQSLLGVPITKKLKSLLNAGYKVRIYVPFGKDWHPYSLRRLRENPKLATYILKNLFHIGE